MVVGAAAAAPGVAIGSVVVAALATASGTPAGAVAARVLAVVVASAPRIIRLPPCSTSSPPTQALAHRRTNRTSSSSHTHRAGVRRRVAAHTIAACLAVLMAAPPLAAPLAVPAANSCRLSGRTVWGRRSSRTAPARICHVRAPCWCVSTAGARYEWLWAARVCTKARSSCAHGVAACGVVPCGVDTATP